MFSGQLTGEFEAFDANDGKKLWQFQTGSGIEGQPVTWQQDGVQYVAVTSWPRRRVLAVLRRRTPGQRADRRIALGLCRKGSVGDLRVIERLNLAAAACFAAAAVTAAALTLMHPATAQQDRNADQALVDKGKASYAGHCSHCHGPGMLNAGTVTPDLRKFPDDKPRFFTTVKIGQERQDAALGRDPRRR